MKFERKPILSCVWCHLYQIKYVMESASTFKILFALLFKKEVHSAAGHHLCFGTKNLQRKLSRRITRHVCCCLYNVRLCILYYWRRIACTTYVFVYSYSYQLVLKTKRFSSKETPSDKSTIINNYLCMAKRVVTTRERLQNLHITIAKVIGPISNWLSELL